MLRHRRITKRRVVAGPVVRDTRNRSIIVHNTDGRAPKPATRKWLVATAFRARYYCPRGGSLDNNSYNNNKKIKREEFTALTPFPRNNRHRLARLFQKIYCSSGSNRFPLHRPNNCSSPFPGSEERVDRVMFIEASSRLTKFQLREAFPPVMLHTISIDS